MPGAAGAKACCDVNSRGPALYENKLIIATLDGRLIALDRITGAELWSTVTVDQTKMYTITGAPRVVKDKVVIGNAGAEFGVRGYVSAYDADTGELAWRFYVVPGDPAAGPDGAASDKALAEIAAPTWFGALVRDGRRRHAVGRARLRRRSSISSTSARATVARGTASIRSDGRGDNLFLASVLALDPDTGEYLWHYQEAPGESWDFTSTQPMILADLTLGGEPRKVHHARAEERLLLRARPADRQGALGEQLRADLLGHARRSRDGPPRDRARTRTTTTARSSARRPAWARTTGRRCRTARSPGLVYFRASRASMIYRNDPDFRVPRRPEQHRHLSRPADGSGPCAERRRTRRSRARR